MLPDDGRRAEQGRLLGGDVDGVVRVEVVEGADLQAGQPLDGAAKRAVGAGPVRIGMRLDHQHHVVRD